MSNPEARLAGFKVLVVAHGAGRQIQVEGPGPPRGRVCRRYVLKEASHQEYLDLHLRISRELGTRAPLNRRSDAPRDVEARPRPVLTEALSPDILYGYGDPAVIRVREHAGQRAGAYYMVVTSNDAPDAFPILRSQRLDDWALAGFAFPRGRKPRWALDGPDVSDFWAPEIHQFGDEFRLYFAAREAGFGMLAIGVAKAALPEGPFLAEPAPLLTGNVIDPNVLTRPGGASLLFWKQDANDLWPLSLARVLEREPAWAERLFPAAEDRRTAQLAAALVPWLQQCLPMERFFALQPFIESVTANYSDFRRRLAGLGQGIADVPMRRLLDETLDAMTTPVYGQRLSPDGLALVGERKIVLTNDQAWEAHLVEGVWVTEQAGRYYLFYAGNDFSTAEYGIGVAIADAPLGPYWKMDQPLVRSTRDWIGPGHPSVAMGPDSKPLLFLHAFFPGELGYKRFRAVLALPIEFKPDAVVLR